MISVIIVTYNNCSATLACLESLYAHHAGLEFEIILVDNASTDATLSAVRHSYPAVHVLAQSTNAGFGAANNIGARAARGEFLFLLNNDTVCSSPMLQQLADILKANGSASAAAPRLVNTDGSFQLSAGHMPSITGEWRTKRLQRAVAKARPDALNVAQQRDPVWVSAAALMIRTDAYRQLGGFDERFFMYFEDVDLCVRLRAEAGPILYEPSIVLIHLGGGSWKNEQEQTLRIRSAYRNSQLLFYAKHHGFCQNVLLRCFLAATFTARAFFRRDAHALLLLKSVILPPNTLLKQPHQSSE